MENHTQEKMLGPMKSDTKASTSAINLDGIVDTLESVSNTVVHGYKIAEKEIKNVAPKVEQFVRRNPILISVGAAGIGYIAGRYFAPNSPKSAATNCAFAKPESES